MTHPDHDRPVRRIGFVAPRSNTVCEVEFNALASPGVSFHAARMRYAAGVTAPDKGAFMLNALDEPLQDLALCDVSLTLLACSTASMAADPVAVRKLVQATTSTPFTDVWDATLDALVHVGARRVALFTPYIEAGNRAVEDVLRRRDIQVVSAKGLGLNTSPERFRGASRLGADALTAHVRGMDLTGANGLLLACCDMPTLAVIERLEDDLSMPVISTIQALYWAAARSLEMEPSRAAPRTSVWAPQSWAIDQQSVGGMIPKPPILIAGAGIGGLTAALALQRAGFAVRVFEQAATVGDVGAGLQISANGSRILIDLGLGEALRAVTAASSGREIRLWNTGQTWTPYEISTQSVGRYGAPYWLVHRGDLHRILLETVLENDRNSVRLGSRVASCRPAADSVEVELEGVETATGSALIGADGVHSAIRRQLTGGAAATFTGKMAWRGLVPMSRLGNRQGRDVATNWIGVGRNVVTYPVRRGEMLNFVGIVERSDWTTESWTARGDIAECQADFAGWHEDVRAIISQLDGAFKWALLSRPPLTKWTYGRTTLLGDAAHPTLPFLGQGAVMAIEDAGVLGLCLADCSNDLPEGLRRYEALRRPRTSEIVSRSAEAASHFHNPALADASSAADFIERAWRPEQVEQRYDWLYAYDYKAA